MDGLGTRLMATGVLNSSEEFQKEFDASGYLSPRYREVVESRHGTILRGLHELYSGGASGLKILEVGCGPVVAHQISAAPFASEIVMADLVESNRDALQLWLDKNTNAHDWTPFFRYVVQILEGKGEEEIARREEHLRNVVKAVIHCNALEDPPVPQGYEGPYDVVVEIHLLSSICSTERVLTAVLVRLSKLLKPGGRLVSSMFVVEGVSSATHPYFVGGKTFAALNVSEEMLQTSFAQAGFTNLSIIRSSVPHRKVEEATYHGMVFISAVKSDH